MTTTHIEVQRKPNENNMSILRRFRQQAKAWGGVKRLKTKRYYKRDESEHTRKKQALRARDHREETTRLHKLGKIDIDARHR